MTERLPGKDKRHLRIAWSLLGGLLLLRLPYLGGIAFFAKPAWLDPSFQVGTYLLTAGLIWWERERLADFHIDGLALAIIILFKPIQGLLFPGWRFDLSPLAFQNLYILAFWIISLGLFLALRLSHTPLPKVTKTSWRWFGLGLLAGFISILVTAYPMSLEIDKSEVYQPNLLGLLVRMPREFIYHLGYAAVTEEPLFRAFLWVHLLKAGWKPVWVWLFQAGLFMLGHIYYINVLPVSFWLLVPLAGLILGALVWRSKTISSSLAAHAIMNTLGYPLANMIASLRL